MTGLPKVSITPHDGGWFATCNSCGFVFWHVRRHVVDEQAITHQKKPHTRTGGSS